MDTKIKLSEFILSLIMEYSFQFYNNVINTTDLLQIIQASNHLSHNNLLLATIIDLNLISDLFHLKLGCYLALQRYQLSNMKTKVFSDEICHCLSGTSKISESLQYYRISEQTTSLVLITLSSNNMQINQNNQIFIDSIQPIIRGNITTADTIFDTNTHITTTHLNKERIEHITKTFKLLPTEIATFGISRCCTMRMATKDIMN